MSFWDEIQKDLKKNIQEGLEIFREGGAAFSEKVEKLTEEGKKKYKVFNLNMKVQEEFSKLGGQIYDLINKKSKNPLGNRKVSSTIKKINKLEAQINKIEEKEGKKPGKTAAKKTAARGKSTGKTKRTSSRKTKQL
jgi:hypothetical protein